MHSEDIVQIEMLTCMLMEAKISLDNESSAFSLDIF
jgi:hypothetical protein